MQTNDYYKKYNKFFQQSKVESIVSNAIKVPSSTSTHNKYAALESKQLNDRIRNFKEALKDAISSNDASLLYTYIDDIKEISSRNSNAARMLVENYLLSLVTSNNIFYTEGVALAFLKRMCVTVPKDVCIEKCGECFVTFINRFDEMEQKNIANQFHMSAKQVGVSDAWILFRGFRLNLGCSKNKDFTDLDNICYMNTDEGKIIYSLADAQLRALFEQQARKYNERIDKEKRAKKAIEDAEREKRRKEEEAESAKREQERIARQRKEARSEARALRAKIFFKFLFLSLPLDLTIAFIVTNVMLLKNVSPVSDFWLAMYVKVEDGVITYSSGRVIAGIVFAGIFAIFQLMFLILAMKDDFDRSWFEYEPVNVFSFVTMLIGAVVIVAMNIAGGVYWGRAASGDDLFHEEHVSNRWSSDVPERCIVYLDGNYLYLRDSVVANIFRCADGTDIVIPAEHHGNSVGVSSDVFKNNAISKVVFQDGTKNIGNAFAGRTDLVSVEIPNTVTSIAEGAFKGCTSLVSIKIPASVSEIKRETFSGCTSLREVILESGLTSIEAGAFMGCSSLTSIEIPDTVKIIGGAAFTQCVNLKTVKMSSNIESVGLLAFYDTAIYNNQANWTSKKGLYLGTVLIEVKKSGFEYEIASGTRVIADGAFTSFTYMHSLTIPNSVKFIGTEAFKNCSGLPSVVIPNSVERIGKGAFSGCDDLIMLGLPFVGETRASEDNNYIGYIFGGNSYGDNINVVPKSLISIVIGSGTNISNYAFYQCESLHSITLPSNVTSIGDHSFYGCIGLTSISIPSNVKSIGRDAFYGCSGLTSITIPNGVTSIGSEVFGGCRNIIISCEASSKPSEWDSNWNSSNYPVVWNCNNNDKASDGCVYTIIDGLRYTISDGVATVINNPRNTNESIVVPASITYKNTKYDVTAIGKNAFYNNTNLTSITIPNSINSIDSSAFSGCSNIINAVIPTSAISAIPKSKLQTVVINGGTSIGYRAFSSCSTLISITIPETVTSIEEQAFYNCSSLLSITISNTVTSIGYNAFYGCSSLIIYCEVSSKQSGWNNSWNSSNRPVIWNSKSNDKDGDGYAYSTIGGIRYSLKSGIASIIRQANNISGSIEIPNRVSYKGSYYAVTSINNSAFYNCSGITSISMPTTVTSIGDNAFQNCSGLTSITIPNSVTSVGTYAFSGCSSATSVSLSTAVTSISNYAFEKCSSLTSLTIPNGVTSIGYSAFSSCSGITSITIPNSVTRIETYAFSNCSAITTANIPTIAISTISKSKLQSVVINGGESIDGSAFYSCSSLTSVTIQSGVTRIGYQAFRNCSSLTSISIPNSVTSIEYQAFENCSSLTKVSIPSSVSSIGEYAFRGCDALTIHCAASSKPSGWNSNWNYSNCPVIWNSKN